MKTLAAKLLTLISLTLLGCTGSSEVRVADSTLTEFGTYDEALKGSPTAATLCADPKKQLVCHRPPGNPANAHTICIGQPAVSAHLTHHPDSLGACAPKNPGDDDSDDSDDDSDDDSPDGRPVRDGGNPHGPGDGEVDAGFIGPDDLG